MRTLQSQSQSQSRPAQRGASSSLPSTPSTPSVPSSRSRRISSSRGPAMSPLSTASVTLAALLILTVPLCSGAPVELQQDPTDQRQLLNQIDAMCSSYLSADLKFSASDVIGELCVLMLVQKSKELELRENSKRTPVFPSHPLLHLIPQLHTRGERGLTVNAEPQGPGGIQSRGYFLYRPRNGRRSLEYE